jgi:hypothetical protein
MAWPVCETVDECPSGRESGGRRVTDGRERLPGDWRLRTVKRHVVGIVAWFARTAR